MKDKKIYLLILSFIICMISISTISATENTTNKDIISSENNKEINLETNIQYDEVSTSNENSEIKIEENNNNDKESKSETDKTTRSNKDTLTFTDLNTTINNNTDPTINLTNNYKYNGDTDSDFPDGIYINRDLKIYGNGITIDGNNMARIFKVDDNVNVEFHNIKFINGKANSGGAIYGGNAYNCEFTKNKATENGGAINQGNATNCNFTENTATNGGAINQGNAYNSTFFKNQGSDGGAIYRTNAYDCTFIGNAERVGGQGHGGAMYQGNAYNSTFKNNYATEGGGTYEGNAINCIFTENQAYFHGGAINAGNAINCTFINNDANWGGGMYWGDAINCKFLNNTVKYWDGGQAKYGGKSILCRYVNNDIKETSIIDCVINVLNYTSTYMSGEKLVFNLTADDIKLDGFNTTIKIYKDGSLVKTVYRLTGEEWIVDLEPGNYTAELKLTDHPEQESSTASIMVKVESKIIASPVTTTYNDDKYLVITLKDQNGTPISDEVLTVNLGVIKEYTTDAKGQVKINIAKLTPKTYTAMITYRGSDIFNASTGSVKVTVKKATPKITAKQASYKLKLRTKKYTAIIKDNKNKALKNTKVSLKVNGKNYITKTNSKGQAVFKINNLKKKGRYTAVITIPANKYYNKLSKKIKITVKQ